MEKLIDRSEDGLWIFYCPACKQSHAVNHSWKIKDADGLPTITPSVKVSGWRMPEEPEMDDHGIYKKGPDGRILGAKKFICHLFVRGGKIQYLNDCTHEMAGQTVDMQPV